MRIELTGNDVVISVFELVICELRGVSVKLLLICRGLKGFVLLAEADVSIRMQSGRMSNKQMGRNGSPPLGPAHQTRPAHSVRVQHGRDGLRLNVPIGHDARCGSGRADTLVQVVVRLVEVFPAEEEKKWRK